MTADDALLLRPLTEPVFEGQLWRHRDFSPQLRGVDLDPVVEAGRAALEERPRTGNELRAFLAERFPALDAAALAYACQMRLALVQVPPRGLWGQKRPGAVDDGGVMAPATARRRSVAGRGRAPLPRRLRACLCRRRCDVVAADRPPRGLRAAPAAVAEPSATSAVASSSTYRMPCAPIRTRRRPCASCPSTRTTSSSHTTTAAGSSTKLIRAALAHGWSIGWGAVLHDGVVRGRWRLEPEGVTVAEHVPVCRRRRSRRSPRRDGGWHVFSRVRRRTYAWSRSAREARATDARTTAPHRGQRSCPRIRGSSGTDSNAHVGSPPRNPTCVSRPVPGSPLSVNVSLTALPAG